MGIEEMANACGYLGSVAKQLEDRERITQIIYKKKVIEQYMGG
jgi:hypothetical protein